MSGSTAGRAFPVLVCIAIVVLAVPAAPREPPEFEMVVVPPLQTSLGELPDFIGADLSERGHVVGIARSVPLGLRGAVRFSAARGLEDLDPNGEYRSEGIAVNKRGTVLGAVDTPEMILYGDPFLYRDRGGFDFLEKGKTDAHRTGLIPGFMVQQRLLKSDTIFGSVLTFGTTNKLVPYIYTPRKGWVDLSGLHPRFSEELTFGAFISAAGYQVFVITGQPREGEEPPTGVQEYFVRSPDGRIDEVVSPGRPVTSGGRPNSKGRMAGLYLDDDGRMRAYVWTPSGGLVDIHPEGYRESYATGVTRRGAVVGAVSSGNKPSEVFVYTERKGLEIVISERDVEELVRAHDHKGEVGAIYPTDINDRLEIVGNVVMRKGPDFSYYYSPKHGLFDLGAVLDDLDVGYREFDPGGGLINNRGQILLDVTDGRRSTSAILRRVSGR